MNETIPPDEWRQPGAAAISKLRERKIVFLFCLLAAVHVLIFSAVFPFFNNVDEQAHFDLVVKYSQGHVPQTMESPSSETTPYVAIFSTLEYLWPSNNFPDAQFPPPWTQPMEKIAPQLVSREASWSKTTNHDSSQPPLYYALAGAWWRLGKICGFHDGVLLYWLRFLNVIFVAVIVWLGWIASRLVFPENFFLHLGVPALLAFMPQTAFYSINNDVLSPLCFGAAFVCLVKLLRAEIPDARLGTAAGLALAATFLTKVSNLPLLAVALAAWLLKIVRLAKAGKLRASLPSLASLFFCAGLPVAAWLAWCKINFGDFTGSAPKIHILGWTLKPFDEWWHHPIFSPQGLFTFLSRLLATFWQGEFSWHSQPLALSAANVIYFAFSILLAGIALLNLLPRFKIASAQRQALWFGFWCFMAAVGFLGFLSIIYDFHDCYYPSREQPYFISGRLMLGALIPFMLFFGFGLDCAMKRLGLPAKFFVLAVLILFMLISEIAADWPAFSSKYNWFHM